MPILFHLFFFVLGGVSLAETTLLPTHSHLSFIASAVQVHTYFLYRSDRVSSAPDTFPIGKSSRREVVFVSLTLEPGNK